MTLVLVTGAQGNVGREVVRACLKAGLDVRAATRVQAHGQVGPSETGARHTQVSFDFTNSTSWTAALTGVELLFLLRPPQLSNMKTSLCPFIDAAYAAGVKHLVFLSVDGAQTRAWVPHRKVEDHLRCTAGSWTVLRPGFFAQNLGDAYREDVRDDSRLFVPAASGRVAFLDVADIGDVAASIFCAPQLFRSQAIRLAGPEAITFEQLANRLSAVLGRRVVYVPASIAGYMLHLRRRRNLSLMQVLVLTVLHVGLRHGDAEAIDDRQFGLIGRPATPIGNYLERTKAEWM